MTDTEYNRTSPFISNSLHYFSKIYPYVGEFLYLCPTNLKNFSIMEQPRRYPIGIQTFSGLVNKHYLYIDKTKYVYRMAHGDSKYLFLNRPRRFGKSLLTSTLHAYFEVRCCIST